MAVRRNNKRKNTRVTRRPNFRKNTRGGVKIRKKQLVRARQSIVETKKRSMGTLSGKLDVGRFITHFSTRSFLDLRQGLLESQMVGQNIFSKYYSMKIKLNFPTTHPIVENFRLQLVWGWMTAPLAYPASSNTGAVTRDEVDLDDIQTVVAQRVEHDFNQKIDQMNFRDKEKTVYRVLGKEWVKPDRRHQIGHNQSATAVYNPASSKVEWYERGSLEPWTKQLTWKPMKRMKLTGTSKDGSQTFYYPNENWIPFAFMYSPNLESYYTPTPGGVVPDDAKIDFQTNDCHWFTDS